MAWKDLREDIEAEFAPLAAGVRLAGRDRDELDTLYATRRRDGSQAVKFVPPKRTEREWRDPAQRRADHAAQRAGRIDYAVRYRARKASPGWFAAEAARKRAAYLAKAADPAWRAADAARARALRQTDAYKERDRARHHARKADPKYMEQRREYNRQRYLRLKAADQLPPTKKPSPMSQREKDARRRAKIKADPELAERVRLQSLARANKANAKRRAARAASNRDGADDRDLVDGAGKGR